ncbi:MAG: response regulator transcription factor [Saprospirales bacterium]|nr:response regulator transcription factor [Saprospirales bacterium]
MVRIFIADDHVMFAEGLESMLAGEPDFEICGWARNATDTLEQVPKILPDVLLLDINLPDQSGLDVCKELRKTCPGVKILALSMHNDESYISAMLSLGAQGYVLKNTGKEALHGHPRPGRWENVFYAGSDRHDDAKPYAGTQSRRCQRTAKNQPPRKRSIKTHYGRTHHPGNCGTIISV